MITRIGLIPEEMSAVERLLRELVSRFGFADDPEFCDQVAIWAHELPHSLRSFCNAFRLRETPPGGFALQGLPIDQDAIGPTPPHWDLPQPCRESNRAEFFLMLVGGLLGDAFCFGSQQNGRLVHNVLPVRGDEYQQLGSGSRALLQWHTEDAFHPYRADYVLLQCMRNPDRVATTFAVLDPERLSSEDREILHSPRFHIRPDESHQRARNAPPRERANDPFEKIDQLNRQPDWVPLLFGDPESPYFRVDTTCMDTCCPGDLEAARALERFCTAIESHLIDVQLVPGEILVLDNYRAVHGRRPFHARHDGSDRWLKRILVSRDLRKSRYLRREPGSRVVL